MWSSGLAPAGMDSKGWLKWRWKRWVKVFLGKGGVVHRSNPVKDNVNKLCTVFCWVEILWCEILLVNWTVFWSLKYLMNQSIVLFFFNFICLLIHIGGENGIFTQEFLLCLLLFLDYGKMSDSGSLLEMAAYIESEKMTYTEQASKRNHCMRLTW